MTHLTLTDYIWLAFVTLACLYAIRIAFLDRKASKKELKDADDFEKHVNEMKHNDYDL